MTKIYHNPRCSKSRAALALLQERGLNPEIIEYLKTPLNAEQIQELIAQSNLSVREAMRTTEDIYSTLGLAEASDDELLQSIAAHPILLNRPLVQTEKGVRLARPLEAIEDIL
ncbi:arsenate reductase (glutaredoxin) [Paenalcaligenes faecalis]|uniref:arsenate reductase (glutaredoxin) n=1 Tax=Paenalcaligenes faecalis TaxID=2980099 RepID=UPI0022B99084|nr:arsenate reductase (glutaredoxin) [Paenalcaligenes faecalis]